MNSTECQKMPQPKDLDRIMPVNGTAHACRFYMHICKAMRYQCSGTACLRYLFTDDYVTLLGYEIENPFIEGVFVLRFPWYAFVYNFYVFLGQASPILPYNSH